MNESPVQESPPQPTKRSGAFYLWSAAGVLALLNIGLLLAPMVLGDQHPGDDVQKTLEEDTQAFDRLSFWQRLISGNSETTSSHSSQFDGQPIDPDFEEEVVTVMIDNFVTARPQHSGIREASIVYEALAEGGITRLMLVFPYQETPRVGPVRSARDYFVDFAEEYGGIYVHAGGSPQALEKIFGSPWVMDLDEDERLEGETYSFRDQNYLAPHNLYFDLLLVREWAQKKEWNLSKARTSWCFAQQEQPVGIPAAKFQLDFANDVISDSTVQFHYDPEEGVYKRFYGSQKLSEHIDQYDRQQVAPTNVIVQVMPSFLIDGDEKERIKMEIVGEGKAFFYQSGMKRVGTWKKPGTDAPTQYFDETGQPICMLPGQTWIAVVDDEGLLKDL